jgi:ABC-type multidrug transport system fused ATPase/permease subunit
MLTVKTEIERMSKILGVKYRRKFLWLVLAQAFLSLFDLLFLATISLAVYTFSSSQSAIIPIPVTSQQVRLGIVSFAILLFSSALIRTIGSLVIQRTSNQYFAIREAEISTEFANRFFMLKWDQKTNSHSSKFLQVYGQMITSVFNLIFRQSIQQFGEIFTLLAVVLGLLIVNPVLAIAIISYFILISLLIISFTTPRLKGIGYQNRDLVQENLRAMLEAHNLSKEINLTQENSPILNNLYSQRLKIGTLAKEQSYLQSLPRQILELGLILGFALILLITIMFEGQNSLLQTTALITAASFRIIPSINSLIVGFGNFRNALPYLEKVMNVAEELEVDFGGVSFSVSREESQSISFNGDLVFDKITYRYPNAAKPVVENFSFRLPANKTLWINGESGTGKSTLLMLLVGFLEPQSGKLYQNVNGETLGISSSTSGISYLSQEFALLDETFARNIALRETTEFDVPTLRSAAKAAGILSLIDSLENGFNSSIGEHGSRLSRGERQRLGLARAIFSNPRLLILDEPTSNLDESNERFIWDFLEALHGSKSIILVSHRKPPTHIIDFRINFGSKSNYRVEK